jgi:glutamate dehydrogenase (NADP+)
LQNVLEAIYTRDPAQPEFHNAVHEVATSLQPLFSKKPELVPVFAQLCEPERQIIFRVAWLDDDNQLQVNRGFRVQFSSAIGPYKGGLRFHPSVNLSILKMLGFEQVFKNALTSLPLGGAKGGSDFNPKGRSDGEIQRFCQSFMTELSRHISEDVDVPAGDIGVGAQEIGYLFGQYKRITGRFEGVLTGKGETFGGSICRPEATGYGTVFMAEEALQDTGSKLEGARCLVSGAGNVALHCAKKLLDKGAVVLSLSDSKGTIIEKDGFTAEKLDKVKKIKRGHTGKLEDYVKESDTAEYFGDGQRPWRIEASGDVDVALPCATQNELDEEDARSLLDRGCKAVVEGANMPTTAGAVEALLQGGALHVPGKMANAGGVAVSGLEMAQNRAMSSWESEEVLSRLSEIMTGIYRMAKDASEEYDVTLGAGANIAAFMRVAEALQAQGAV